MLLGPYAGVCIHMREDAERPVRDEDLKGVDLACEDPGELASAAFDEHQLGMEYRQPEKNGPVCLANLDAPGSTRDPPARVGGAFENAVPLEHTESPPKDPQVPGRDPHLLHQASDRHVLPGLRAPAKLLECSYHILGTERVDKGLDLAETLQGLRAAAILSRSVLEPRGEGCCFGEEIGRQWLRPATRQRLGVPIEAVEPVVDFVAAIARALDGAGAKATDVED